MIRQFRKNVFIKNVKQKEDFLTSLQVVTQKRERMMAALRIKDLTNPAILKKVATTNPSEDMTIRANAMMISRLIKDPINQEIQIEIVRTDL
jgi:hypothetical protein